MSMIFTRWSMPQIDRGLGGKKKEEKKTRVDLDSNTWRELRIFTGNIDTGSILRNVTFLPNLSQILIRIHS